MTIDVNPFEMNYAFMEPIIMLINDVGLDENEEGEKKMKEDMELDLFENIEKLIYPKVREDLLDFLLKQRDANANVTIYLRWSAISDRDAAKAVKEHKEAEVEKERKKIE